MYVIIIIMYMYANMSDQISVRFHHHLTQRYCHAQEGVTRLHVGCSSYTDPHIQLCSHQIIFDTPEDYDRQDLFTNTQNTSTLKLQHTTLSQHKNQFRHWSVSDICKLESPITGQHQIYAI